MPTSVLLFLCLSNIQNTVYVSCAVEHSQVHNKLITLIWTDQMVTWGIQHVWEIIFNQGSNWVVIAGRKPAKFWNSSKLRRIIPIYSDCAYFRRAHAHKDVFMLTLLPKVAAVLLRFQGVADSNLGPEIGYPDRGVFSVSSRNCEDRTSN
jgi:hypothetical protein